ncbi:MAG TPA: sulfoxide reductase heme-binding subunit YedZ [Anaerolineae bacterium]|nr:sulfoxide reductase heme-binding subunit YedZ [Anaerolineae bacterium]
MQLTQPMTNIRKLDRKTRTKLLRIGGHLLALYPLAALLLAYRTNGLGADPVREILLRTGEPALVFLILSLAITPLGILFGWKQLYPLRRIFGLYAFMYVALHLATFLWLDYGLNLQFILDGVLEQHFALIGFVAFLLLVPLAVTSNRWSQKKLGKKWSTLHKLVFLIIALALIHFWWLVKNVYYMPFFYTAVVLLLLTLRWTPVKQKVLHWQRNKRNRRKRTVKEL